MAPPPIIVAGLDGLGLAVMRELRAAGAEVVAIGSAAEAAEHGLDVERLGVRLTVGSARSPGTLAAAGLPSARALVLTADDDTGNVESALAARRIAPDLPVVIRLFNEAMSTYLQKLAAHGIVAIHVSNRHLELASVVAGIAAANSMVARVNESGDVTRVSMEMRLCRG